MTENNEPEYVLHTDRKNVAGGNIHIEIGKTDAGYHWKTFYDDNANNRKYGRESEWSKPHESLPSALQAAEMKQKEENWEFVSPTKTQDESKLKESMNIWENFIHTHLPIDGVRKWIEDRAAIRDLEESGRGWPAIERGGLFNEDMTMAASVPLTTPMTQIPAGVSMAHNDHLIESSERTIEHVAASKSWNSDLGEGYMADTAEAAYKREIEYHAWEDLDADMDRKKQQINNALDPEWNSVKLSHPIDHLRGNGYGATEVVAAPEIQTDKGQPDLFSARILSYPPESRGPSEHKPTESAQYQAEQTFYGKYNPTMSQQQRNAGRVATSERQDAQSGLFGTMERQQEKEL